MNIRAREHRAEEFCNAVSTDAVRLRPARIDEQVERHRDVVRNVASLQLALQRTRTPSWPETRLDDSLFFWAFVVLVVCSKYLYMCNFCTFFCTALAGVAQLRVVQKPKKTGICYRFYVGFDKNAIFSRFCTTRAQQGCHGLEGEGPRPDPWMPRNRVLDTNPSEWPLWASACDHACMHALRRWDGGLCANTSLASTCVVSSVFRA